VPTAQNPPIDAADAALDSASQPLASGELFPLTSSEPPQPEASRRDVPTPPAMTRDDLLPLKKDSPPTTHQELMAYLQNTGKIASVRVWTAMNSVNRTYFVRPEALQHIYHVCYPAYF
jgi:hypothetical protein